MYKIAGPNEAMIISGGGGRPKVIVGGGCFVIPLLQKVDIIKLNVMNLEISPEKPITTENGVPIFIDATALVKVNGDELSIQTAAEQFAGMDQSEIAKVARDCILSTMVERVGTLKVEEFIANFEAIAVCVAETAMADLAKMGLWIVAFNIKSISDQVGYLEEMGKAQLARVRTQTAEFELEAKEAEARLNESQLNF